MCHLIPAGGLRAVLSAVSLSMCCMVWRCLSFWSGVLLLTYLLLHFSLNHGRCGVGNFTLHLSLLGVILHSILTNAFPRFTWFCCVVTLLSCARFAVGCKRRNLFTRREQAEAFSAAYKTLPVYTTTLRRLGNFKGVFIPGRVVKKLYGLTKARAFQLLKDGPQQVCLRRAVCPCVCVLRIYFGDDPSNQGETCSVYSCQAEPTGFTQEGANTGASLLLLYIFDKMPHLLLRCLLSFFIARRVQPSLFLVDNEVEFCLLMHATTCSVSV